MCHKAVGIRPDKSTPIPSELYTKASKELEKSVQKDLELAKDPEARAKAATILDAAESKIKPDAEGFNKALSAEEVKELYEAQKKEFVDKIEYKFPIDDLTEDVTLD